MEGGRALARLWAMVKKAEESGLGTEEIKIQRLFKEVAVWSERTLSQL